MVRLYKRSSPDNQDAKAPENLEFFCNGEPVEIALEDPFVTVLAYLRESAALTGAKHGCRAGNCGACTVAVGEARGAGVEYKPVYACCTLLAELHGRHLVTVEGIGSAGKPHPLQQSLVSEQAVRCGYCTPGMIMSLYCLCQESSGAHDRSEIQDAISGNLCACTGYRSIRGAATKVLRLKDHGRGRFPEKRIAQQLRKLGTRSSNTFSRSGRHCHIPAKPEELAMLVRDYPDAILLGGDPGPPPGVPPSSETRQRVISLEGVDALKSVRTGKDMITLAAAVSMEQAQRALAPEYPQLGELIRNMGGRQIRGRMTLAGSLARGEPCGGLALALVCLDTGLTLRVGSFRRHLQIGDFYDHPRKGGLKSGEFIESVQVPRTRPNSFFRAWRVTGDEDNPHAAVCAAFFITLDTEERVSKVRIFYGAASRKPLNASEFGDSIQGQPWTLSAIQRAMPALDRDIGKFGGYANGGVFSRRVARNLLKRFFLETRSGNIRTRVGRPGLE